MSLSDESLIEKIAESGADFKPQLHWEDAVRRGLSSREPAAPTRTPIYLLSGLVLAGALTIAFLLVQRSDERAAGREQLIAMNAGQEQLIAMNEALKDMEEQMSMAQLDIDMAMERIDYAFLQLEAAESEEERQDAMAMREKARAELEASRAALQALKDSELGKKLWAKKVRAKKVEKAAVDKCAGSTDPLCGL